MSYLTLITCSHSITATIWPVIGGMAGAFIIEQLRKLCGKTISVYSVNNDTNRGGDNEKSGEPMHGKGEPITLDNKPVWQWTNSQCQESKHSIVYGPYSHNLNLPGKYKIKYLIKGNGFKKHDTDSLLILDVVGTVFKYIPYCKSDGSPILDTDGNVKTYSYTDSFRIYGSRTIKKKELSNGKWNNFSVEVYSSGSADLYEFRVRELNNYELPSDEKVYFDTITVRRIGI